jgi:hypothetical protein
VNREWSHPPRYCQDCKAARAAKWYDKSCERCGVTLHVNRDWDKPPRFCPGCKSAQADKWYDISCGHCGAQIHANRDWDKPPKFCKTCREAYPPRSGTCEHCSASFAISTGLQLKCKDHGWELPRKCPSCRELFKQKPFRTVKESTLLGQVIYRTYNSRGDLISESRDETTVVLGIEQRRHRSGTGKTVGITRAKETIFGTPYRETKRDDGSLKSRSQEKTSILGNKYTESVGGSSETTHRTTTQRTWLGRLFRRTE